MLTTLFCCALLLQTEEPDHSVTRPITIEQCIYMAAKHAFAMRIGEVDIQIAKADLGGTLGDFDTVAFLDGTYTKANNPTASGFAQGNFGSAGGIVTGILRKDWQLNTGFRGNLLNGASYQADVNWSKATTSAGTFGGFNPEYRSDIGISFLQPLLRNFGTTVTKAPILKAHTDMLVAAEELEEGRILLAQEVIKAYWEYHFARRDVDVKAFLVSQGEKLVRINQKRLEVGDARKLDVIEAESDLATRRKELITARNEVETTADELKRRIYPVDRRGEWDVELIPVTEASEEVGDLPTWREGQKIALARRPELRRLRELLKKEDLEILVAQNQILPRMDLNASLRFNQLADSKGEVLNYDDQFYTITAGVSMEMPIGNRSARYGLAAARLRKIRALLEYKDLESQIIQEVRNGVRDVLNRKEEIESAREAVRLNQERWSAEQKRQEVGYSTTFQVREAQATWREAMNAEFLAVRDFQFALAELAKSQGILLDQYGILPAPRPKLNDRAGIHFEP